MDNNSKLNSTQSKPIIKNEFSNKKTNNIAIFSLVLEIVSIILFFAPIYPIFTGLTGFILGIIGITSTHQKTTLAIAGVVTSVIGLIIGTLSTIIYFLII